MMNKFHKISMMLTSLPVFIGLGAVLLFIMGYVAHAMWGANSAAEEIAEELLQKDYNIRVEFSGENR